MSDRKITQFDIMGRTMVNMVDEEPSGAPMIEVNSKSSVLMDAGLTDTKIIPHNGVPMKEAYMYGNTLVNLMTNCKDEYLVSYHDIDNPDNNVANISMMKPNTEYTLFYKAKYRTEGEGAGTSGTLKIATSIEQGFIFTNQSFTTEYEQYAYKITTSSVVDCFVFSSSDKYFFIKECVLLEGDHTQEDIPYFEGMKSVEAPVFTSIGKNLFDKSVAIPNNYITVEGIQLEEVGSNRNATPYIKVNPNTSYVITGVQNSGITDSNTKFYIAQYDINKNIIKRQAFSVIDDIINLTTDSNTVYIRTTVKNDDLDRCQIEESSIATAYEPYKVNTLAIPNDLVLRKVGDYADKLDLNTGKLVRYIGEIIFDGSSDEVWELYEDSFSTRPNTTLFKIGLSGIHITNSPCICPDFIDKNTYEIDEESVFFASGFRIRLNKTKLETDSVSALRTWLSQNPITVQYVLAIPEISTIPLTSSGNWEYLDTNTLKNAINGNEGSYYLTTRYTALTSNGIDKNTLSCNKLITSSKGAASESLYSSFFTSAGAGYLEFYLKGASDGSQIRQMIEENGLKVYYQMRSGIASNKCKLPMYFKSGTIQTSTANSILPTIKYSIPTENYYQLDRAIMNKEYTLQGTESLFCNNASEANINFGTYLSKIKNTLTSDKVYYSNGYWKRDLTIVEGDQLNVNFPTFYGLKNVEINSIKTIGKNLVDMTKFEPGRLDSGMLGYADGTTDYNFSNTSMSRFNVNSSYRGVVSDWIKVSKNNIYTITWQTNNSNFDVYVAFYDINKKLLQTFNPANGATISNPNFAYIRIWCHLTSVGSTAFRIQLEKGDSFTGFEPYKELAINTANTELMGIEDYKDIINLSTNTKTQKYGKIVLNGSEDWYISKNLNGTNTYFYYLLQSDFTTNIPSNGVFKIYCDKFISDLSTNRPNLVKNNLEVMMSGDAGNVSLQLLINAERLNYQNTTDALKNWLADNPITVVYKLATDTKTNIVFDQTQISNLLNSPLKSIQIPSEISPITALKVEAPEKQTVSTQSLPSGKMYCDTTPVVVKGDYTNSTLPQNLTLSTATNSEVRIDGISYKLIGTDLRSVPNGIKDELDIKRGKLIRRVNKLVINGQDVWAQSSINGLNSNPQWNTLNSLGFVWRMYTIPLDYHDFDTIDNSKNIIASIPVTNEPVNMTNCIAFGTPNSNDSSFIAIKLSKDLLSEYTEKGICNYLKEHPVTVYYKLRVPTETPIQILTQAEYDALVTKPEVYVLASEKSKSVFSNSYISTSSEDSVNAEVNYIVPMYNYYAANKLDFNTEYYLAHYGDNVENMELNGEAITINGSRFTTPSKDSFTKRIFKIPNLTNAFAKLMIIKSEAVMQPFQKSFQRLVSVLNPKLKNQIEVKDSTLELHSLPNGVCDELDMITGRYVKRVEKLDIYNISSFINAITGGEDLPWGDYSSYIEKDGPYIGFRISISDSNSYYNMIKLGNYLSTINNIYCNMIESHEIIKTGFDVKGNLEYIFAAKESYGIHINFKILKSRLNTYDTNGFKQWLVNNQVFLLVELQTPEVSYIDLNKYKVIDNRQVQTENIYVEEGQTPDSNGYYIQPALTYTLEKNSEIINSPITDTESGRVIDDMIVKGNTLKNLMTACKDETLIQYFYPEKYPNVADISLLKSNTEYTLFYKAKYQEEGNVGWLNICTTEDSTKWIDTNIHSYTTTYQQYFCKFTTPPDSKYFVLRSNGHYFHIKECILLEGDYTNYPIEYFEGLKHVENPVVKVSNGNLWQPIYYDCANMTSKYAKLNDIFEIYINSYSDSLYNCIKFAGNEMIITTPQSTMARFSLHNLKPNTDYTISYNVDLPDGYKQNGGNNGCHILGGVGNNWFNTRKYIKLTTDQNGNCLDQWLVSAYGAYPKDKTTRVYDIQLHEGNNSQINPTLENTTYSANNITLYSTPTMCDELDMNTGKLTRRLGKVVLDGLTNSGATFTINSNNDGTKRFTIVLANQMQFLPSRSDGGVTLDNIQKYVNSNINLDTFSSILDKAQVSLSAWKNVLVIQGTGCTTIDELNTYLQSNPIEVIYPLANPTTEDVTINKEIHNTPTLRSYEANSVVTTNSITKPLLNMKGKKYRLKDLKPNTSYVIRFSMKIVSEDADANNSTTITFDLGGSKYNKTYSQNQLDRIILTTPTVLQHKYLYITSNTSNVYFSEVMVVPNTNLTRTESVTFFEGISSTGNAEDNIIKVNNNGIVRDVKLNNRLRKLSNTVYDEYIPERGIIIKRVGKVILDGSEDWKRDSITIEGKGNLLRFRVNDYINTARNENGICDKVISRPHTDMPNEEYIRIAASPMYYVKDLSMTIEQFKAKLAKDPITVYYQLATPEIIQVNLNEVPTELEIPVYQSTANHVIKTNNIIPPTLTFKSNAYYELSAQGDMLFSCICEEDVNIEINGTIHTLTNEDIYSSNLRTLHLTCDLSMTYVQVLNQGKVISSFMVTPANEQQLNYTDGMDGVTNITLASTGRNLAKISRLEFSSEGDMYATVDQTLGQVVINNTRCNTGSSETHIATEGLRNGYYVASCRLGGMTAVGSVTHRLRLGFLSSVDKSVSLGEYTTTFDNVALTSGIFHITNANTIKAISIIDEMNYIGENPTLLSYETTDEDTVGVVVSDVSNYGIDVQVSTAQYTINELTLRRFNTLEEAQAYTHSFDAYEESVYNYPTDREFNSIPVNTTNGVVYYSDLLDLSHGIGKLVIGDTLKDTNYNGSIEIVSETANTLRFAINIPGAIDTTLDYKVKCNLLETVTVLPETELQYVYLDKPASRILVNINKSELNTVDLNGINEWITRKQFRVLYILAKNYRREVVLPKGLYTKAIEVKSYSNIQVKGALPAIVDYIPYKLQEPLALPSANMFTLLFDLQGTVPETARIILGCVDPADLVYGYECSFTPKLGENRVLLQLPAKKVITNEYMGIDCHGAILSNVMLFAGDVSTSTQISTSKKIIGIESCLEAEKTADGKYPLIIKANTDTITLSLDEPLRGLPNSDYDEFDFHNHQLIRRVNYKELTSAMLNSATVVSNGEYINVTTHVLGTYTGINRMVSSSYPAVALSEYDLDYNLKYTYISYIMDVENNDLKITINNYPGTLAELEAELDIKPIKLIFNGGEPRIEDFTLVDNELVTAGGQVIVGTEHRLPPYINYEKAEFELRKETMARAVETQIQLKSNTLYTAIFTLDKYNSVDENVRVGLGGTVVTTPLLDGVNRYKVAVTTPITLINNVLSIDAAMARVSNLVLLEGNYTSDNYVPNTLTAIESVGILQADGTYLVTIKSDNTKQEATVAYKSSEISFNIGSKPLLSNSDVRDEIVYDIVSRSYKLIRRINPNTFETLEEEIISNVTAVGSLKTYDNTHIKGTSNVVPNITLSDIEFAVKLRPSTTYTVLIVSKSILGSGSVSINLGGTTGQFSDGPNKAEHRVVLTTPAILAHEKLIISGARNVIKYVRVVEGNHVNSQIPLYFESVYSAGEGDNYINIRTVGQF